MEEKSKSKVSAYDCCRNDRVEGLRGKVQLDNEGKPHIELKYEGKYGQGYDGCGSHSHDPW